MCVDDVRPKLVEVCFSVWKFNSTMAGSVHRFSRSRVVQLCKKNKKRLSNNDRETKGKEYMVVPLKERHIQSDIALPPYGPIDFGMQVLSSNYSSVQ